MSLLLLISGLIATAAALPADIADPIISKLGGEQRYQPMRDANGTVHMVDTWLKASDIRQAARFTPDTHNVYHLFTRANPTVSQWLQLNNDGQLSSTNFDPRRRTVVLIHGWTDSLLGGFNTVLVPAFLANDDVNVISVDWGSGSGDPDYLAAVINTVTSGEGVARFINWLNQATGATPAQYHIVGHSLGGHQAGIVGRHVHGEVDYVTALDPALPAWVGNPNQFHADDGAYTEVIHTNAGMLGYVSQLGHVDFFPNGGISMPGCGSASCSHDRCFHYLAESLYTRGFTGSRCASLAGALIGNCFLPDTLQMGGARPKTGATGIYYLTTNAGPPFSMG